MFPEADEIKVLLEEEIQKLANQLRNGMCDDFYHYKNLIGVIEGLTRASQLIDIYRSRLTNEMEKQFEH